MEMMAEVGVRLQLGVLRYMLFLQNELLIVSDGQLQIDKVSQVQGVY